MRKVTPWVTTQATTVLTEMLRDRGYTEVEQFGCHETFLQGGSLLRGTSQCGMCKCDVISIPEKIGVKVLRGVEEAYGNTKVIIVTMHKPTPPCLKQLLTMRAWCCIFEASSILRNITHHELVPRHRQIQGVELEDELKRWRVRDLKCLPVLLSTDPLARYLGLQPGNVVKVTGPEGTQVGSAERFLFVKDPL